MESSYVKNLRDNEIRKFDRYQTKQNLKKILSEYDGNSEAVKRNYNMTKTEIEILEELTAEQKYEEEQGKLFVKGFTEKDRMYE